MLQLFLFDFPMTKSSIWTELYCLVIYLIILCCHWNKAISFSKFSNRRHGPVILFICFAIITFCTLGDFYHLMHHLHSKGFVLNSTNFGVEYIYGVIGGFVQGNYFLFRTIVFGSAFILFCKTAKRFGINPYYAALYMYISHVILFSYARATLAMAVYFYGLSFLCIKKGKHEKILHYCFALFLIYTCKVFHTSTIILTILTITIFLPFRKWSVIVLIIMIPIIKIIFTNYLDFLFTFGGSDDYFTNKLDRYVDREQSIGIARIIIDTFSYLTFYLPFAFSTVSIFFKNKYKQIPTSVLKFYKISFSLIFVSSIFYLLGEAYFTFFYRILYMSMIPLSIIVLKLYQGGFMSKKMFIYSLLPGIPYMVIRSLYAIYLGNLGIQ